MRSPFLALLLLLVAASPLAASATEGRDAPSCVGQNIASLAPTIDIDPGVCVKIDLGTLTPGEVFEMEIIIVDDALDVLIFDENGIIPYDLGQSYRSTFVQPASTELALGAFTFHWEVPPSISAKQWFLVLDNLAHDGDGGDGDQGGVRSKATVSATMLLQSYWTPFNNLVHVPADDHLVLLSGDDLRLDADTSVVISAWDLEGSGDVYLQTRSMHDRYLEQGVGVQYITGGALQSVENSASLTWIVPSDLDGDELVLIVDNTDVPLGGGDGATPLRMTVRVELAPPLAPSVNDDSSSTVSIDELITMDASATPNRLGQVQTVSWDFDDTDDSDEDGDASNDQDALGIETTASWDTPGEKTITVTITSPTGEQASGEHTVTVIDTVAPTPRIQSSGTPVSDGWKVERTVQLNVDCLSSTDDDAVSGCLWTLDGQEVSSNTTHSFLWDEIGSFTLMLTVSDATGNSATTNATLRSVDTTLPTLDPASLTQFPTEGELDEPIQFTVSVEDAYDSLGVLRVHWDLNPSVDTDGNNNPRDDPDLVGLRPELTFDRAGSNDVVVTVFDASNNSDSYAFSVKIATPPSQGSMAGLTMMVLFIACVTGVVAVLGYRSWQKRLAMELLMGRGLSKDEAEGHLGLVAQRRAPRLFSNATELAGLDAGEVTSLSDQEAAAKKAELEAIYGSSDQEAAAFAPPQPMYVNQAISESSMKAANEAAALLNETMDTPVGQPKGDNLLSSLVETPAITTFTPPSGVEQPSTTAPTPAPNRRAGVALPQSITSPEPPLPEPTTSLKVRQTCSTCQTTFELDMPEHLTEALVGCPKCGTDQTVQRR